MSRTLLTTASSAGTAALLLLAVSACGGSSTPSTATPTSGAQQTQAAGPGAGDGGQRFPGASGKVAAISGTTLQVQSAQTGQVAVTYTAKTTFTEAVRAHASAVHVGSCVSVRSTAQGSTTAATDPVTAASLQLSEPVKGECDGRGAGGGLGGFGGFGGGAAPDGGTRPSGAPTGAPPGTTGGTRGAFAGARPVSGRVTAVDGATITVASVTFAGRPGAAGSTASPVATPSTTPVTVTTTSTTTYTKTVSATAKDLAVGQCVTAIGSANDTGAVTATVIASQPAVNGECAAGFGPRRTGTGGTS